MIQINVRFYTEKTLKKDMPLPDANELPDGFMGIVVKADESKLSNDLKIKESENLLLDYLLPRLQGTVQTICTGDPSIYVVLAPDAENSLAKMIRQIIIDNTVAQAMMKKYTPKNPNRIN